MLEKLLLIGLVAGVTSATYTPFDDFTFLKILTGKLT
jgi:hypothetical protein